jgi:hypothetical protein
LSYQTSIAKIFAAVRAHTGWFGGALPFVAAFVLSAAMSAGTAHAQDERSPIEVARAHMEQGQAYYLQGRFGEAATEFEAAYEAQPFSAFLYNAGVAYENAGQPGRALDYFRLYLERDPNASDAAAVEQRISGLRETMEARRAAREAAEAAAAEGAPEETSTEVDAVSAPPPEALPRDFKSLVSVRTEPEGANVTILRDGERIAFGPSPFSHTLDQGEYRIRIEHPDFNVAEQNIDVEPGKVYVVIVNLSQGEFLGYLRVVASVPGAQVFIDDHDAGPRGQSPFEGPMPVGPHHIWIERPGYSSIERDVEIGIGSEVEIEATLERVPYGRVRVIGNVRGARVSIDGELVGTIPFEGQVDAGPHELRVEADGMKAFVQTIDVQRGQLTPLRVRLRPAVGRGGAWVAMSFAALSLGGGIALAVVSDDLRSTLQHEQAAGRLANHDPRLDHGIYMSIGADSAFALAAVLAGLGMYYMFEDSLPPSEGTVLEPRDWALAPMLDPRAGVVGGTLGGRF